jgi:hypothetical protein
MLLLLPVADGGGIAPRIDNEHLLHVLLAGCHLGGQVAQRGYLTVAADSGGRGGGGDGGGHAVHITVRAAL